ncbi:hypothetical protein E4T56_gene10642 [Termitomyces sp. T112]|nr:hypothetical protein E4T56_gene10642 [Termitomyces sp. T112]KNZ75360.1 hypothetical protein J132_03570 [Termitomyces sp. J132]
MKQYSTHDKVDEERGGCRKSGSTITNVTRLVVLISFLALINFVPWFFERPSKGRIQRSNRLGVVPWNNHCAHTSPIDKFEYYRRQNALVEKLLALNASAYIAEPGASATFFGNISQTNWKLSERPLLLIITPSEALEGPLAKISVLTPKFEATRAKSLLVPSESPVQYIEWPEDANPYELASSVFPHTVTGTIYVDSSIRKFIADGFELALPNATILSAPETIRELRERKSKAEIDLLKCANEATVLAIRAVHQQLYVGIRESRARAWAAFALASFGLENGGCLTLFGENAALPHGSGTDRALNASDFALFDCTASLHGYYSDVTRTVALPGSTIPLEHHDIWKYVRAAQTTALRAARAGVLTRSVDGAARQLLGSEGYATYFTHRLGHGIGLEVHEDPYLRGGSDVVIRSGHTFSDEPGIYIEGQVGVRLEDCFVIREDGAAILLTEGVGGQSQSPWAP